MFNSVVQTKANGVNNENIAERANNVQYTVSAQVAVVVAVDRSCRPKQSKGYRLHSNVKITEGESDVREGTTSNTVSAQMTAVVVGVHFQQRKGFKQITTNERMIDAQDTVCAKVTAVVVKRFNRPKQSK